MNEIKLTRGRTFDQRLGVRWPRLAQLVTAWVMRLPAGSRLRHALMLRTTRTGLEAWVRGDLEASSVLDDPEIETRPAQASDLPVDFDPVYYGREGHCRVMELWSEAWRHWSLELDEVVEVAPNQVLVTGRYRGEAMASGIELARWGAVLYVFRHGRILRVENFFGVAKADAMAAFHARASMT